MRRNDSSGAECKHLSSHVVRFPLPIGNFKYCKRSICSCFNFKYILMQSNTMMKILTFFNIERFIDDENHVFS